MESLIFHSEALRFFNACSKCVLSIHFILSFEEPIHPTLIVDHFLQCLFSDNIFTTWRFNESDAFWIVYPEGQTHQRERERDCARDE